ncbi:hypothetical protein CASFOL_039698 [Castilleja foliolosa]|uniref:Cytochrome b561 and DOMON domain-containing protein n=1 Tax=Castilleja foliolosa TaxID=1961234 RepID=A0ABD3BGF4_9LAMI
MAFSSPNLINFSLLTIIISLFTPSETANCTSQSFPTNKQIYSFCNDLPTLNSYLHWSFDAAQSTLKIAFVAPPAHPSGWIAWAINPTGLGMLGSQALVAFRDASGKMAVKTYSISSYDPIKESKVWYSVSESSAEFSGGYMRLFATLVLPEKGITVINHVWQVGGSVSGKGPGKHDTQSGNLNSKGKLYLSSGQSTGDSSHDSRTKPKNIHGILNVISWGILFPIGIIIARYMKTFPSADPAWFYLHVSCQLPAYVIGVAGWGIGLHLAAQSKGITYYYHRNIGITLFCIATVQVFALFLRPNKDHRYRVYWNIYHHGVGCAILVLAIINVFKGFDILRPDAKWRNAYIAVIAVLGGVAVFLEVITWIITLKRKKSCASTMRA